MDGVSRVRERSKLRMSLGSLPELLEDWEKPPEKPNWSIKYIYMMPQNTVLRRRAWLTFWMLQENQSNMITTKNCLFDVTVAEKAGLWWFVWKELLSFFILLFSQLKDIELIRLKIGRSVDWIERINLFELQPHSTNLICGYSLPEEREGSWRQGTSPGT